MKKIVILISLLSIFSYAGALEVLDSFAQSAKTSEVRTFIVREERYGVEMICMIIVHEKFQKMNSHCVDTKILEKKK